MKAKFRAIQIANFYIQLANSIPNDGIDNLKLNKLLYFAQGRSLSELGRPLFEDAIEAWDYGPVLPEVYHVYKVCESQPIKAPNDAFDENELTTEELSLLTDVYVNYGKYTGVALMNMTHQSGTPWSQVHKEGKNVIIPNDLMKDYFCKDKDYIPFAIDESKAEIIEKVPSTWDAEGDEVYGTV